MLVRLLALFNVVFLCYGHWESIFGVCGDGIVSVIDEECDSTEHCTSECNCEVGHYSENGHCLPICSIDGCLSGCATPNYCPKCNFNDGYSEDCHRCAEQYYSEGFLKCKKLGTISNCHSKKVDGLKKLTKENPVALTPNDFGTFLFPSTSYLNPISPYADGIWIQLDIEENGEYIIESDKHYSQHEIVFSNYQRIVKGTDTVLVLTSLCPFFSNETIEKLAEGNDVSRFIKSSRLSTQLSIGTYYLFVFSPFNKKIDNDFQILLTQTKHICGYEYIDLSSLDLSQRITKNISNSFVSKSKSACTVFPKYSSYFHVQGNGLTIFVSTCSSSISHSTSIHLLKITSIVNESNFENVSKTIDCVRDVECMSSQYSGCSNSPTHSTLISKLEHDIHYFIQIESDGNYGAEYQIDFRYVCNLDCGENGFCDYQTGKCKCFNNYVNNDGFCSLCGNGQIELSEECDWSHTKDDFCNRKSCICRNGFISYSAAGSRHCKPLNCGNNEIDPIEECDGGSGCKDNCMCEDGYFPYQNPRTSCLSGLCGNGRIDEGEECDGGDGCFECECKEGWHSRNKIDCQPMSFGLYVGLAMATFVGLHWLLWILLFLFFQMIYRIVNYEIQKEIREVYALENKIEYLGSCVVPFSDVNSKYISSLSNKYFEFNSTTINFENCSNQPEVNQISLTKILFSNTSEDSIHFIFHGQSNPKYDLLFQPTTGFLKKGRRIEIEVIMKVKCTCIIHDNIPVTIRFGSTKKVIHDIEGNNPDVGQIQNSTNSGYSNSPSRNSNSAKLENKSSRSLSVVSSHTNKKKMNKITKFHSFLHLNIESSLSTNLDYDEIQLEPHPIGNGAFGIVYKGKWRSVDVAVKQLRTDGSEIELLKRNFIEEVELMERIRCPHVVNFIGSVFHPNHLCVLTEFCPLGSLRKFLKSHESIEPKLKIRLCQDTARAMEYLHLNDILHADLKTDNILVVSLNPNDSVTAKVSDFGTSRCFLGSSHLLAIKDIGTPTYMAPEIHSVSEISLQSDVFSFAVCMLEVWTQSDVYDKTLFPDTESIYKFVGSGKRVVIPNCCAYKSLIELCWKQDPNERPSFNKIVAGFNACFEEEENDVNSNEHSDLAPAVSIRPLQQSISRDHSFSIDPKIVDLRMMKRISLLNKNNDPLTQASPNKKTKKDIAKLSTSSTSLSLLKNSNSSGVMKTQIAKPTFKTPVISFSYSSKVSPSNTPNKRRPQQKQRLHSVLPLAISTNEITNFNDSSKQSSMVSSELNTNHSMEITLKSTSQMPMDCSKASSQSEKCNEITGAPLNNFENEKE